MSSGKAETIFSETLNGLLSKSEKDLLVELQSKPDDRTKKQKLLDSFDGWVYEVREQQDNLRLALEGLITLHENGEDIKACAKEIVDLVNNIDCCTTTYSGCGRSIKEVEDIFRYCGA